MPIKIRFPYNTTSGVIANPVSLNTGEIAINTADRTVHVKQNTGLMKRVMGTQGAQGFQGPAGVQGFQGIVGAQGSIGIQGFIGGQGIVGAQGSQGSQSGVQGSQGAQGLQGFQGIRGNQGFTGVQGVTGSQGFVGAIGFQGTTGAAGNQGFQGLQGSQGDIGRTGFVGTQGPAGAIGPAGPQGARGPTGATGPSGFSGPTGPTGPRGPQGFPGTNGGIGPYTFGAPGGPGPTGFPGPDGILYYAYVGGGGDTGMTCFPAGSMVLMADGSWKPIELVSVGDKMYSPFGTAICRESYITNLGDRKMFRMADNSISWSSEHTFWVKRGEEEYLWTMDKAQLKLEEDAGVIKGIKNWNKIFEGVDGQQELFGHIDGFKLNTPVEIKEYYGNKNLPLFLPLSQNGELIVVNGYIVGAAVNEYQCDYSQFKWNIKEN